MADAQDAAVEQPEHCRPSLRRQLLVGLNAAMLLVLVLFLFWDYRTMWRVHLSERRETLRGEARIILSGVRLRLQLGLPVRDYVDRLCAKLQGVWSPGHHVVAYLPNAVVHALPIPAWFDHTREQMRLAAAAPLGLLQTESGQVIIAGAWSDGVSVYTCESVSDIRHVLRAQVLRRTLSMLSLGLTLAIVVNLAVGRLVVRPVRAIVDATRRMSQGEVRAQAKVTGSCELAFLAAEFNAMSARLARVEQERQRQMARAQRIQKNLVPSDLDLGAASVIAVFEPVSTVAGDYYDVVAWETGTLTLCLADVSGHGVPAALLAAMLKSFFKAATVEPTGPECILAAINRQLCAVTLDEDFASMILVAADPSARTLIYASAGHEPGFLLPAQGELIVLPASGPVLGVAPDATWDATQLKVNPGDRLVLITDGLPDATSPSGEMFGRERLRSLFLDLRGRSLEGFRDGVLAELRAHGAGSPHSDDITMLVLDL